MFLAKNLKKLINQTNIFFVSFLLAAALLFGCGKEKSHKDFIAKVDDSYLSDDDISKDIDTSGLLLSHKNEYVRNWIETELFYNEAVKEGILNDEEFKRILDKSKKELAKAFLFRRLLERKSHEPTNEELLDFFNSHKDEFRLSHNSFLYNKMCFNDENKAILFRSSLIESDWNSAANAFGKDNSIKSDKLLLFEYDYQIQPASLLSLLQELNPNEVSIVLNTEPNEFAVVQLIRKYSQNDIPSFEDVKSLVTEKFLMRKREQVLHDYLKYLYSNHKIELKSGK